MIPTSDQAAEYINKLRSMNPIDLALLIANEVDPQTAAFFASYSKLALAEDRTQLSAETLMVMGFLIARARLKTTTIQAVA